MHGEKSPPRGGGLSVRAMRRRSRALRPVGPGSSVGFAPGDHHPIDFGDTSVPFAPAGTRERSLTIRARDAPSGPRTADGTSAHRIGLRGSPPQAISRRHSGRSANRTGPDAATRSTSANAASRMAFDVRSANDTLLPSVDNASGMRYGVRVSRTQHLAVLQANPQPRLP